MESEQFESLVGELCEAVGLPDAESILESGRIEVEGFDVDLASGQDEDPAIYLNFDFGICTAGRTLPVFQLMLESNLLVYAWDQAQLGMNPDTGGIVLIVRVADDGELSGDSLAGVLTHYAEHGRYWRKNIIEAQDEMFEGLATGNFVWIRA